MKKTYFISDIHLGLPNHEKSLVREKLLVAWLDEIKKKAAAIFLLGDVFDVWFEYKRVVPRGYTRFLGKIAEITDSGIPVHYFAGNHDHWITDYLTSETGITLHRNSHSLEIDGKKFFLAHGDGLGPNDKAYKRMKKVFTNPLAKWLYSRLHPNFGVGVAAYFSGRSRNYKGGVIKDFKEKEEEWLVIFSREMLAKEHYDFFIFGHRHKPFKYQLSESSYYINLGDWITNFSFAVFDGNTVELKNYINQTPVK